MSHHAIQGRCRHAFARDFLKSRQLGMSSRYEISAHRFENAAIVACAWVRKCQYLYGQEVTDASLVDRDFPPAVFAAYEERSELVKFEGRVGKELHARVKQLRDMFHVWALA